MSIRSHILWASFFYYTGTTFLSTKKYLTTTSQSALPGRLKVTTLKAKYEHPKAATNAAGQCLRQCGQKVPRSYVPAHGKSTGIHFRSYVSEYVLMQTSNITCAFKSCFAEAIKDRLNLQSESGKSGHKKVTKLPPHRHGSKGRAKEKSWARHFST